MPAAEHTPRFAMILGYLHTNGPVQLKVEDLAAAVDVPPRSLARHLARMEELGIVIVTRPATFEHGREPNIYRALVDPDEWAKRAAATLAKESKARARERDRRRRELARDRQTQARAIEAQEEEHRQLVALLESLDAPDPIIVDLERSVTRASLGMDDDDLVDAWIGGALD